MRRQLPATLLSYNHTAHEVELLNIPAFRCCGIFDNLL